MFEVLSRPHAVRFLQGEGILKRVALAFGPPDLPQRLAAGPSATLSEYGEGEVDEFDNLELPSSESLWNLDVTDDEAWRRSLASSRTMTVREAHDCLFQGEQTRYSAFAARVLINALFLQVWNHKRSFEALQDVVTEYKLRLALETWEKSLQMCEPETVVVQLSAPHKGRHQSAASWLKRNQRWC